MRTLLLTPDSGASLCAAAFMQESERRLQLCVRTLGHVWDVQGAGEGSWRGERKSETALRAFLIVFNSEPEADCQTPVDAQLYTNTNVCVKASYRFQTMNFN